MFEPVIKRSALFLLSMLVSTPPWPVMHGVQVYTLGRGSSPLLSFLRPCLFHSHPKTRPRTRLKFVQPVCAGPSRTFSSTTPVHATHRDQPVSSLLSKALDQRQQAARDAHADNVGPFMMGTIQRTGPKQKKWSELTTKGKGVCSSAIRILVNTSLCIILTVISISDTFNGAYDKLHSHRNRRGSNRRTRLRATLRALRAQLANRQKKRSQQTHRRIRSCSRASSGKSYFPQQSALGCPPATPQSTRLVNACARLRGTRALVT